MKAKKENPISRPRKRRIRFQAVALSVLACAVLPAHGETLWSASHGSDWVATPPKGVSPVVTPVPAPPQAGTTSSASRGMPKSGWGSPPGGSGEGRWRTEPPPDERIPSQGDAGNLPPPRTHYPRAEEGYAPRGWGGDGGMNEPRGYPPSRMGGQEPEEPNEGYRRGGYAPMPAQEGGGYRPPPQRTWGEAPSGQGGHAPPMSDEAYGPEEGDYPPPRGYGGYDRGTRPQERWGDGRYRDEGYGGYPQGNRGWGGRPSGRGADPRAETPPYGNDPLPPSAGEPGGYPAPPMGGNYRPGGSGGGPGRTSGPPRIPPGWEEGGEPVPGEDLPPGQDTYGYGEPGPSPAQRQGWGRPSPYEPQGRGWGGAERMAPPPAASEPGGPPDETYREERRSGPPQEESPPAQPPLLENPKADAHKKAEKPQDRGEKSVSAEAKKKQDPERSASRSNEGEQGGRSQGKPPHSEKDSPTEAQAAPGEQGKK